MRSISCAFCYPSLESYWTITQLYILHFSFMKEMHNIRKMPECSHKNQESEYQFFVSTSKDFRKSMHQTEHRGNLQKLLDFLLTSISHTYWLIQPAEWAAVSLFSVKTSLTFRNFAKRSLTYELKPKDFRFPITDVSLFFWQNRKIFLRKIS